MACYIIRASFSQERMAYITANDLSDGISKVIYQSKDEISTKTFEALDWLAAMCSHVPNRGEQMARYYGYYSNVSRGKREKADADDQIPCILEPELTARLSGEIGHG
ncbi:MAG: transposase [Desulfobacterales bacterium]|nr:transposase [Desulfobacterales bacterium]